MPTIEYFFSTHSGFAYFGSRRLYEIAAAAGRRVVHKPFDFWPVLEATRSPTWPKPTDARRAYFFGREMERWSAYRGAPIAKIRPTWHDEPLALSSGLVIACEQAGGDVGAMTHAILEAHWRDDADIANRDTLAGIAARLGHDADALLIAAASEPVQAAFKDSTEEAIRRSVFGSPTYVVDGDMFYGQDRLEMIEHAFTVGFPPSAL